MLLCIIHSNKSCFGPLTIVIHSHFMHIITIRALSLLYFTRTHIFLLNKKISFRLQHNHNFIFYPMSSSIHTHFTFYKINCMHHTNLHTPYNFELKESGLKLIFPFTFEHEIQYLTPSHTIQHTIIKTCIGFKYLDYNIINIIFTS